MEKTAYPSRETLEREENLVFERTGAQFERTAEDGLLVQMRVKKPAPATATLWLGRQDARALLAWLKAQFPED